MNPPSSFTSRLHSEFNHRLRLRWSEMRREFHVEQKVARGEVLAPIGSTFSDEYICARDGYAHVMAIRDGDRMPCKKCRAELKVPIHKSARITCPHCKAGHVVAFFPLEGDALIQHLRSIDPTRSDVGRRVINELNRVDEVRDIQSDRAISNIVEDTIKDNFTALFHIPTVGYTGREFTA